MQELQPSLTRSDQPTAHNGATVSHALKIVPIHHLKIFIKATNAPTTLNGKIDSIGFW